MRVGFFAVLIALISTTCWARPAAFYTPDKPTGLNIVTAHDGQWEYKIIDGTKCATTKIDGTKTSYIYFKLNKDIRSTLGSDVWLVVDFYDDSFGMAKLDYNSTTHPYASSQSIQMLSTNKWQRALIHMEQAKLSGAQNGGADFRFAYNSPLAISRVEVYASKPNIKMPSSKERIKDGIPQATKPKGMFYTFGNDADETIAALSRAMGATSIESYVSWEKCEREAEGKWDWSQWDNQVQILKENDLKWVPFIILGPAYSTPDWFRKSKYHVPCRCLEHETDSKIESVWNPYLRKYIERFISEFAKRYANSGVIESLVLGVQGDYGEAIFPVSDGGWIFDVPGEYHGHPGFWCGDPYALKSFRKFAESTYGSADALNKAWGTSFTSIDKVDFPGRQDGITAFETALAKSEISPENTHNRRRWLDFVGWYRGEMTQLSDWWLETTRKYFPQTPIYLCTGGDARPKHGSNFSEQCKVAAKHNAGVRITNEASDYAENFLLTRWVASAGKHYGAYFGFEPAGYEDEKGIVARIYNATASGANQTHDYTPNVLSSKSRIDTQRANIKWLFNVAKPIVPVAMFYPNVDMTLNWYGFHDQPITLRDFIDYDYIDETMLRDGALAAHKILVIWLGTVIEKSDANIIAEWIKGGGRAMVLGIAKFMSVEGTSEPEQILFGNTPNGRSLGKGEIVRVANEAGLAARLGSDMRKLGLATYDLRKDGIFGTQIEPDKFLFLNTGPGTANVKIECNGKVIEPKIKAGAISEVEVK